MGDYKMSKTVAKPICRNCPMQHDYLQSVDDYNKLVTQHNNLVEDANAEMKFLEDLSRGLHMYVTDTMIIGTYIPKKLNPKSLPQLDPSKQFCLEFHNEIVDFLLDVRACKRPVQAYAKFIAGCMAARNKIVGGSINGK